MILAVIPARGGSKTIPKKNIKLLYGLPLITYSIRDALNSKLIDRFIVTTDCPEIANISVLAGAKNIDIRPDYLCTDSATTLAVLRYVLDKLVFQDCEILVLLQPTSPIRGKILDYAIQLFLDVRQAGYDCLATGFWTTHTAWTNQHGPRQQLEEYFHDDGCVYIWNAEVIRKNRWQGDRPFRMAISSIYNVEIDNEADFYAVEGILARVKDRIYE